MGSRPRASSTLCAPWAFRSARASTSLLPARRTPPFRVFLPSGGLAMVLRIPPLDAFSNTLVVEPWCVVERKRGNQAVSIRVLVAEDAPVMRTALAALISADPALELVGMAEDAVEAIVLALSARAERDCVVEMRAAGAACYMLKGIPADQILRTIRDCALDVRSGPVGGGRALATAGRIQSPWVSS